MWELGFTDHNGPSQQMMETQPGTEISCPCTPGSCGKGAPAGQRVLIQGAKVLLASRQSPSSPVDLKHSSASQISTLPLPSKPVRQLPAVHPDEARTPSAPQPTGAREQRTKPTLPCEGRHSSSLQALSHARRRLTPHVRSALPPCNFPRPLLDSLSLDGSALASVSLLQG